MGNATEQGRNPEDGNPAIRGACQSHLPATAAVSHTPPPAASGGERGDLRQGVSETAHRVLDELDLLDGITDPHATYGKAHAQLIEAGNTVTPHAKAARLEMAAAALIRSAELLRGVA